MIICSNLSISIYIYILKCVDGYWYIYIYIYIYIYSYNSTESSVHTKLPCLFSHIMRTFMFWQHVPQTTASPMYRYTHSSTNDECLHLQAPQHMLGGNCSITTHVVVGMWRLHYTYECICMWKFVCAYDVSKVHVHTYVTVSNEMLHQTSMNTPLWHIEAAPLNTPVTWTSHSVITLTAIWCYLTTTGKTLQTWYQAL